MAQLEQLQGTRTAGAVGEEDLKPQALDSVEDGQLSARVRSFPAHDHPCAGRVGGQVARWVISAIWAPSRSCRSSSMAGSQSRHARMAARMGSVIATPTEKQVRTPCSRR